MFWVEESKDNILYVTDGEKIIDCEIYDYSVESGYWENKIVDVILVFKNKQNFEYLLQSHFDPRIIVARIDCYENWNGINLSIRIDLGYINYGVFEITVEGTWEWDFSSEDYFLEFSRIQGSASVEVEFAKENHKIEGIRIFPITEGKHINPFDLLQNTLRIINDFHNEAILRLDSENEISQLKYLFNFPQELKVSCDQYLLYFAQFLQDLGINATSNLKHDTAGKTFFEVKPKDDKDALNKIREALAVYLHLPASPIAYDDSFAAVRLHQQIDNLQLAQRTAVREIRLAEMELRLAQTVINSQDKIIIQKDTLISQQSKIIEKISSASIMMDSVENKEEFVKVFDGLEVGESKELKEKLGIKFNPITSLKSLGNKFIGNDDEIIELNLDKND